MARRGLTLLEVLSAAALLAVSVALGASLVSEIARYPALPSPPISCRELGDLAERILEEPQLIGVPVGTRPSPGLDISMELPSSPGGPKVRVRRVEASSDGLEHAWLVIECDGASAARFIPVERGRSRS